MKKISPNYQDSNRILEMHTAGIPVCDMAEKIQVEEAGIQLHIDTSPRFNEGGKDPKRVEAGLKGAATRAANKAAEEELDDYKEADTVE